MPEESVPTIVWLRLDLRIEDNLALIEACRLKRPILPLFIWDPESEGTWRPGAASRWWLHQSLVALSRELESRGSRLTLRKGRILDTLQDIIDETGADRIYWNRRYEPALINRDRKIQTKLKSKGLEVATFNSSLLFEPDSIHTGQGKPYQVFTPFYKTCLTSGSVRPPVICPGKIIQSPKPIRTETLDSFGFEPEIDWTAGLKEEWTPGELGGKQRLKSFLESGVASYKSGRDRPDKPAVSKLSPHLHFGEISPNQVWWEVSDYIEHESNNEARKSSEFFLRELAWREFAHHVLYHFPDTAHHPLRQQFRNFPWSKDKKRLRKWQKGRTGFPIVDAGMRELWLTGWMHNRVRMIVASFLTKDLMINWIHGAEWFFDTLVDADLANNTLGWQWAAGCGADAAPYFRIFNPILQGKKFDPDGNYVRKWLPELSGLENRWIHEPWNAPERLLIDAGVVLGSTYPNAIVDHSEARRMALAALEEMKLVSPA
jgi:deoxyribodipyrimidine photo-lyase